jgi:hypothetical protein
MIFPPQDSVEDDLPRYRAEGFRRHEHFHNYQDFHREGPSPSEKYQLSLAHHDSVPPMILSNSGLTFTGNDR